MASSVAPALDPFTIEATNTTNYPTMFKSVVAGRWKRKLTPALGLTNFSVNMTTLQPGAASAHRHWHTAQDEFIFIVSGTATLITDKGEQILTAGMCAGFPKGKADGHHLINTSEEPLVYLEVGDRSMPDEVHYPDIDLLCKPTDDGLVFTRKNGIRY